MSRPRRARIKTEHMGFLCSVEEERIIRKYLKARKMTASEYFREVSVRPLVEAQPQGSDDGPKAA
jgi:hypothetical protein